MQRYESMIVNIAYDYRMTIIIREYEICTEHKYTWIFFLEPGRGIDGHAYYGKTSLHHTDQLAPFWSLQHLRALIDGHCLAQW